VLEARLELSTDPSQLRSLKAALERVSSAPGGEPSLITSIYYDTPDRKLHHHALSLCVEQHDTRRVQVLRRRASIGDNRQWRDVITSETTAIHDEGEIFAAVGDATEPVCDLDLEITEGDPAVLFDAALRLLDAAPLRITVPNNAERGYRLLGGGIEATTIEPLTFIPSMTVEAVLQTTCRACVWHLLRNEGTAYSGNAEGIHQMRVAVRRLRSVLVAVRSMLPAKQYQWLKGELKWLAGSLGPARDWDVFIMDLLAPIRSVLHTEPDLGNLVEMATQRQHAAYAAARKAIESRRYCEAVLKTVRWFETRGWRDQPVSEHSAPLFSTIAEIASSLIERRWVQATKQCKHFARSSLDERHQLRIALKKLRYTIELLESLFETTSVKALMKRLKGLQEDLGHLNDVGTAQRLIRELARPAVHDINDVGLAGGVVIGWHLRDLSNLEARLRADVRRFKKAEPFWRSMSLVASASTA